MTNTSFYNREELLQIGFKSVGEGVCISKKASIYGAEKISIGNHVRIDDFCLLSGNIEIGNYVHIATYSAIFSGESGVVLEDFVGLSSRCTIYAQSDDYSGDCLTNPTVPSEYTGVICEKVVLGRHVILGAGTTVLPGVSIGEGTAVGSMSLVNKPLDAWGIYAGVPCRYKKERRKRLLELEKQLTSTVTNDFFVGQTASATKTICDSDVREFAEISGDHNRLHLSEEFAKQRGWGGRIVHGALISSLISGVLAMKLPGEGTVYLSQNSKYIKPVYINDTITAVVEIINIEGNRAELKTDAYNQNEELVVTGCAKVLLP